MNIKKLKLRTHQMIVLIKYIYFVLYCKARHISNENVWLISERGNEARDNGYFFYDYLVDNHPEVDFKYVITKDSPDLKSLKDKSRIVYHGSKEHFILFITSGYHLSTNIMGCSPEFRMFNKLDKKNLINIPARRIYLNHGVEYANVDGLSRKNVKLDLFICTSKEQYEHEVKVLGHPDGVVQYLGMPRYDYLKNHIKNQILVMPTWRMWLFYCKNIDAFKQTDYYKSWNSLLSSAKLSTLLKKNDLELLFYPHYEIQPYIEAFTGYSKRIKIASINSYDVQTLLNESKLLITDCSSVNFDFAYLNKPIIYYQFDYDRFIVDHYSKGYFSFTNDGFGPVVKTKNDAVNALEKYIKNHFKVEQKYAQNAAKIFTLSKGENCKRVYESILKCKTHYAKEKHAK